MIFQFLILLRTFGSAGVGQTFFDDFHINRRDIWVEDTDFFHCDEICFEARPDHLAYSRSDGLTVYMDDRSCGGGYCCHGKSKCATYAAGHLGSRDFYSYGSYTFRARIAHGTDGTQGPSNAFTCFSVYVSKPEHNEIAICFDSIKTQIHFAWWYDRKMHRHVEELGFDASQVFADYRFDWFPDSIKFYVNGNLIRQTSGIPQKTIPWEPARIKLILRPRLRPYIGAPDDGPYYQGPAVMNLQYVSYTKMGEPFLQLPEITHLNPTQQSSDPSPPRYTLSFNSFYLISFGIGLCCIMSIIFTLHHFRPLARFEKPMLTDEGAVQEQETL